MRFDALILTDPRFSGGTSAAVAADVKAMVKGGLNVGLALVESTGFFLSHERANTAILDLADLDGVSRVDPKTCGEVECDIAFFHHPSVFENPVETAFPIDSTQAILITHQPLFLGDSALAFDPFRVQSNIRKQFHRSFLWAPISGICRQQFRAYAPLLRLTQADWPNAFDIDTWTPKREKLQSPNLVIGRHGRAHPDKWPASGAEIANSLPAGPNTHVKVMGVDPDFLREKGVDTSAWTMLAFNQQPVFDFLDELDVFSYHHSPLWVESFGRTIAEAMLMGVRCVLSPELEPTFGEHAIYARPDEVPGVLDRIRSNLAPERAATDAARQFCIEAFSTRSILGRFQALKTDAGTRSRRPKPVVSPLIAAKKLAGFRRRKFMSQKDAK